MYQKIIVVGHLGGDPDMRYMPDGTAVTNFSMATSRRWNDRQTEQPVEETTWFRVSVWGARAETAHQYLKKGARILVEGRIKPDPATGGPRVFTRHDGTAGASFEIHCDNFTFMGSSEGSASGYESQGQSAQAQPTQDEDDIPF
jgi:single-strand DNA-binding protein